MQLFLLCSNWHISLLVSVIRNWKRDSGYLGTGFGITHAHGGECIKIKIFHTLLGIDTKGFILNLQQKTEMKFQMETLKGTYQYKYKPCHYHLLTRLLVCC